MTIDATSQILSLQKEKAFFPLEVLSGRILQDEKTRFWRLFKKGVTSRRAHRMSSQAVEDAIRHRLRPEIFNILTRYNGIIAGGFVIHHIMSGEISPKEIDCDVMFTRGNETNAKTAFVECLRILRSGETCFRAERVDDSEKAITITCVSSDASIPDLKLQFLKAVRDNAKLIGHGFDLGSCQAIFVKNTTGDPDITESGVYITPTCYYALKHGVNIADMSVAGVAYESRVAKYMGRGFGLACPGLSDTDIRPGQVRKFGRMTFTVEIVDYDERTVAIDNIEVDGKKTSFYAVDTEGSEPMEFLNALLDGKSPVCGTVTDIAGITDYGDIGTLAQRNMEDLLHRAYGRITFYDGFNLNVAVTKRLLPNIDVENLTINDFKIPARLRLLIIRQIGILVGKYREQSRRGFYNCTGRLMASGRTTDICDWYHGAV